MTPLSGPPATPESVLLIKSSLGYYAGFNPGNFLANDSNEKTPLHWWSADPKDAVELSLLTDHASLTLAAVQKEIPDAHLVVASVSWQRVLTITG